MNDVAIATESNATESNPILRFGAQVVSYIFHPLFISSYVMAFLIFVHPYAFNGMDHQTKVLRMLHVFITNALFPAFSVFLMWRLQFIQSIHLRTAKERILPYIIAMIFYWWTWIIFKNQAVIPPVAVHFALGSFLAVCGAWMCNIYFKISMHAIAMGGASMFFLLFSLNDQHSSGLYLSLVILLTGLVCTARLVNSDHSRFEVWSGLFIGILAQYIAWQF